MMRRTERWLSGLAVTMALGIYADNLYLDHQHRQLMREHNSGVAQWYEAGQAEGLVGDFNGDRLPDRLAHRVVGKLLELEVRYWKGNVRASTDAKAGYSAKVDCADPRRFDIQVTDVDQDGRHDIAIRCSPTELITFYGDNSGVLRTQIRPQNKE